MAVGMKGTHTYSRNLGTFLVMTRTTFMPSIEAKMIVRNFQIGILSTIQVGDFLERVEGGSRCPNPLRLRYLLGGEKVSIIIVFT
jgi:hypothetical protein